MQKVLMQEAAERICKLSAPKEEQVKPYFRDEDSSGDNKSKADKQKLFWTVFLELTLKSFMRGCVKSEVTFNLIKDKRVIEFSMVAKMPCIGRCVGA